MNKGTEEGSANPNLGSVSQFGRLGGFLWGSGSLSVSVTSGSYP